MAGSTATGRRIVGVVFAATMMVVLGLWGIFVGIAAIANDKLFVATPEYTYAIDVTRWGWIHLVLAIFTVLTGLALFRRATWARVVGIVMAVLVAINYFLFLPFYPIWSIFVISLAVFVIWSLSTMSRSDVTRY